MSRRIRGPDLFPSRSPERARGPAARANHLTPYLEAAEQRQPTWQASRDLEGAPAEQYRTMKPGKVPQHVRVELLLPEIRAVLGILLLRVKPHPEDPSTEVAVESDAVARGEDDGSCGQFQLFELAQVAHPYLAASARNDAVQLTAPETRANVVDEDSGRPGTERRDHRFGELILIVTEENRLYRFTEGHH